jgi:hypothetical protein
MKKSLLILAFFLPIAISGCISLNTTKVTNIASKEICIVDNPEVWQDFRDAYERRIQAKGYKTQIVKEAAACQVTTTYAATYGVHWGLFLATAELKVFNGDVQIGQASYKAPWGSPLKHGSFENKIESMVDQLLPQASNL